jgi:hypothetical protein
LNENKYPQDWHNQNALNKMHNLPQFYHTKYKTTFGKDKKRYLYRVDEFYYYLCNKYKRPNVCIGTAINEHGKKQLSYEKETLRFLDKIQGRRGIIAFFIDFRDANGHFTFWNGYKCLDDGDKYFKHAKVTGIFLWTC